MPVYGDGTRVTSFVTWQRLSAKRNINIMKPKSIAQWISVVEEGEDAPSCNAKNKRSKENEFHDLFLFAKDGSDAQIVEIDLL